MIRLINQLLDRFLAHFIKKLKCRIQEQELRIQREQAEIDYLEYRLECLRKKEKAELN